MDAPFRSLRIRDGLKSVGHEFTVPRVAEVILRSSGTFVIIASRCYHFKEVVGRSGILLPTGTRLSVAVLLLIATIAYSNPLGSGLTSKAKLSQFSSSETRVI